MEVNINLIIGLIGVVLAIFGSAWLNNQQLIKILTAHKDELSSRIDQLEKRMDNRIDQLEKRFEQKFDQVDQRFVQLEKRMDDRFDSLGNRVDKIERQLEQIFKPILPK